MIEAKLDSNELFGADSTTNRGFELCEFSDDYGLQCSIQESSRAVIENEDGSVDNPLGWIWLGVDDPHPKIMKSKAKEHGLELPEGEVSGWMPYPVPEGVLISSRMHLNEHQVRGLVERLQVWLETGSLAPNNKMAGECSESESID